MKINNHIPANEIIKIEINIPKNNTKGKKENQKIRRLLKLKTGKTGCEFDIEIEMKILTIPIELVLSCDNYKLKFKNGYYYLDANHLFSKETLMFKLCNYYEGENIIIKPRIELLKRNTLLKPKINLEEELLIINIPEIKDDEVKRLNCKIECYIKENFCIPIIIDSAIVPTVFEFQIYDYLNHRFSSNDISLLIPNQINESYNYNFIKYLPNNNTLEFDLYFKINVPYENMPINALIKCNTEYMEYISFDVMVKEIKLECKITEVVSKIKINCDKILGFNLASFTCQINGKSQTIYINKKDYGDELFNINYNETSLFKLQHNADNNSFKWNKITDKYKSIKKEGIYIYPFGYWNYYMAKYIKEKDNYKRSYYKLDPIPPNNHIYFISENGKITEKNNFKDFSERSGYLWNKKIDYFPLFGVIDNIWYPLINEYEDEDELFGTFNDDKELLDKFNYFKENSLESYRTNFKNFIEKNYPETYENLKDEINLSDLESDDDKFRKIYEEIKRNKSLDILKRFRNIESNSFSFSKFANLIYEKTEETINSIKIYFPYSIKSKILNDLNSISLNLESEEDILINDSDINNAKYNLINNLYRIFKNEFEMIENNNNIINFSPLNENEIQKKIQSIKNNLYSYSPGNYKNSSKYESIEELSNDLNIILRDISYSALEENKDDENTSLLSNKYLITERFIQCLDKNANRINLKNFLENSNKSNSIYIKDINDIIRPENYSIKSLVEFFNECSLKAQIFPSFIRYSIINENQEQLEKASHILSELYNIYLTIISKNNSIISSTTKEYQKHFEEMIYKLRESGLNLSKIKELNNLKVKDYDIKDFIIQPDVNNLIMNENNIEQEPVLNDFNYEKKNDKIIIKNFPSEIDNNIVEDKNADNSVSYKYNIGKSKRHNKIFMYPNKDFEEKDFDIEKEINTFIKKLKIIKKKIKNGDEIKFEEELDTVNNSDKLKELLKQKVIKDNSPINKLIENSQILAERIFIEVAKLNLKYEIPYKNLEANILIDCARTISNNEKYFVMFQVCALATVFHSLEIPYLISLIGDSGFKVVLKNLCDEHSIENLQKVLDCVFIKRYKTKIFSCIKAIDNYNSLDKDSHRIFYIFTNGLDEEFGLIEQIKDMAFLNEYNSLVFIFSKFENIEKEQSEILSGLWTKFGDYCKSNDLSVELIEMTKDKFFAHNNNTLELNEESISNLIKVITSVLIKNREDDNNDKIENSTFNFETLNQISLNEYLTNLEKIISDNFFREKEEEPYIKTIKLPQQYILPPKLDLIEYENITKNLNSILEVENPFIKSSEFKKFMKVFKIQREKINISLLEKIFIPNLATKYILTNSGTNVDMNELRKFFHIPTINPKIYRELEENYVRNYGITVIIDSSNSCFGPLSIKHTWQSIQTILNSFGSIDLNFFDLIISGNPNPRIICSEKNTLDILDENSKLWPILFNMINKDIKVTDLASAIRAAYNINILRKSEHPNFIFVITDGLFSLSEKRRIIKNINYCILKDINIIGIGVGISPFGIEELFPNIVYSMNPDKLIKGISLCLSKITSNNRIKALVSEEKIEYNDSNIRELIENPKYYELKNELWTIPIILKNKNII